MQARRRRVVIQEFMLRRNANCSSVVPEQDEFDEMVRGVAQHLRAAGIAGVPRDWFEINTVPACDEDKTANLEKNEGALEQTDLWEESSCAAAPNSSPDMPPSIPQSFPLGPYAHLDLAELEQLAKGCRKCRLCEGRNKVVFGVGNVNCPAIVFVGEGPGADEDRIGEPFVGRAGALLTAAITKGMGLARGDVYICNVVKCRPPGNRTPLPDEVESCTPYLYRQLEVLSPKVIVTLGKPAQLALSGVDMGITKLRGRWLEWRGIKLMPTFHPAYILRNPVVKKEFWEDLQAVMSEVGLKAKGR
jgi:uracil-DNA glycosylase